jgi:hypothetical protein
MATRSAPAVTNAATEGVGVSLNVLDYGADPTGVNDSGPALSRAWAVLVASVSSTTLMVPMSLVLPPGRYRIATSVNWSGGTAATFLAWNTVIDADGAVLIGSCTGKAVVDMIGVRGAKINGLSIYGDPSNIPSCGLLVGPRSTDTCGNGSFNGLKFSGYFSKACVGNVAIETSTWKDCYFINQNPATTAYSYIADGANNLGFTTDYSVLRNAGTVNSLTNNSFTGCRFDKSAGGSNIYLERTIGWKFFKDNYYLAYDNANFYVVQGASTLNRDLTIEGLFETNQGAGSKYCVLIVCPDGETTNLRRIFLDVGVPLAATAVIGVKRTSDLDNMTSGSVRISGAHIRVNGSTSGPNTLPLISGAQVTLTGDVVCDYGAQLNLGTLAEFHGTVVTDDLASGTIPTGNSTAIVLERSTRNIKFIGLQNFASDAAASSGGIAINGLYRNGSAVQVRVT